MIDFIVSVFILILIVILQLSIFHLFFKRIITTWGALKSEVFMVMAGDQKNLMITSTRAITIKASRAEVWKWLIQLGADRCGFYSYYFIEKAQGTKRAIRALSSQSSVK